MFADRVFFDLVEAKLRFRLIGRIMRVLGRVMGRVRLHMPVIAEIIM